MSTKKKTIYERMNEVFHLKLHDDSTVEVVDMEDGETITVRVGRLPALKALIEDLERFGKEKKK